MRGRGRAFLNNAYVRTFLAGFALAFLSLLIPLIRGGGAFTLRGDFNAQYLPFLMLSGNALRHGDLFWNMQIDIGSDFIGSMSYYVLGSPFAWPALLFPAKIIPYISAWLIMVKYGAAAVTSFAYIRRFAEEPYARIGALLYAFSGYQAINMYYGFFNDVVALFPLMVLGYEKMIYDGRRGAFAFGVFVNAFLNYYFFTQEVLFLILYHLCREGKGLLKNAKRIGFCFLEGVTGVLMAGVFFAPSVLAISRNPRIGNLMRFDQWLFRYNRDYLSYLRAMLFPGEIMDAPSCIRDVDFTSWSAYLPMTGIALVLCYIIKNRRNWLSLLTCLCALIQFSPVLNGIFGFFIETSAAQHRWLYMMTLVMSLVSAIVLEKHGEYPVRTVSAAYLVLAGMTVAFMCVWHFIRYAMIWRPLVFAFISLTGIAGIAVLWFLETYAHNADNYRKRMTAAVSLFAVITTASTVLLYQNGSELARTYAGRVDAYTRVGETDERYRVFSGDNVIGMSRYLKMAGSFISTKQDTVYSFFRDMVPPDPTKPAEINISNLGIDGLRELLGGRYLVTGDLAEATEFGTIIQQIECRAGVVYVSENADVLPIGCGYTDYITASEWARIPEDMRALAMLNYLIVPDARADEADEVLRHNETLAEMEDNPAALAAFFDENRTAWVDARIAAGISSFATRAGGFLAEVDLEQRGYVFFSIPYAKGFRAFVDGTPCAIMDINHLMAVPVEKGAHEIEFRYFSPDLLAGLICSCAGWLVWLVLIKNRRRKHS